MEFFKICQNLNAPSVVQSELAADLPVINQGRGFAPHLRRKRVFACLAGLKSNLVYGIPNASHEAQAARFC